MSVRISGGSDRRDIQIAGQVGLAPSTETFIWPNQRHVQSSINGMLFIQHEAIITSRHAISIDKITVTQI